MALFPRASDDRVVFDLLVDAGANAESACRVLRDLIAGYPERAELARDLVALEHEGDRLTHEIIRRLNAHGHRRRGALEPADGYALATALDDIVDLAEETGEALGLYAVEAPMEQAVALADVLVAASAEVVSALRCLRDGSPMPPHLAEIRRLENEGDRLVRDGIACLFAEGIDPMVVIRWKDIFETLEAAVDACETVAHALEGIALKRGARRRLPFASGTGDNES